MEIEELRIKLEEIQNMDSIEDLTDEVLLVNFPSENLREAEEELALGENKNWARDIDMALGMEKDKTQELNETLDYIKRGELQEEIANIRAHRIDIEIRLKNAWLQKQRDQAKETRSQMKEVAKQDFIKEVREIEARLQAEMQENIENTNKQVAAKKAEIAELNTKIVGIEKERESILAIVAENKKVLTLKSKSSQVYQVAKRESDNCVRKAKRRANKIKEMNAQIEDLQDEIQQLEEQGKAQEEKKNEQFARVDEILCTIDEARRDEKLREEQEKLMWEEYRKEQAKEESKKDEEINRSYAEKEKEEPVGEAKKPVKNEEDKGSGKEGKEDDKGQSGEGGIKPQEEKLQPEERRPQEEKAKSEERKPQEEKPKLGAKKPQVKTKKESKNKITKVEFYISAGSVPSYKVTINNGKEDITFEDNGYGCIKMLSDKDIEELSTKHICPEAARKYYDKGLASILESVDRYYGTSGLENYMAMIKDTELFTRYPDELKARDYVDIDYNFSGLYEKPKDEQDRENIKQLKKLAKANARKGLASYEKEPNILQRIFKKFSQKLLPSPEEVRDRDNTGIDMKKSEELGYMEAEREETTPERKMRDLEQLYDEPGFSIKRFVKGMPKEEANKYKRYRDNLRLGAENKEEREYNDEKVQRKIAKNVEKIMQQDEKDEPLKGVVIDKDGREIG